MAITYRADTITDKSDANTTRTKLAGASTIMVQTRLYMTGTYTQRASWVTTSQAAADGVIPAAILGLYRIKKLIILGMPFEVTDATIGDPVSTMPRSGAVRSSTGFFAEYDGSAANSSVGLAGGIILYTGTISTSTAGITSNYAQVSAATNIATSPAALGMEILAFGN